MTAQGGEVAKTVKSGIEKDTAFHRGYLIDDRNLTSLQGRIGQTQPRSPQIRLQGCGW
jgi:hypothetical protein